MGYRDRNDGRDDFGEAPRDWDRTARDWDARQRQAADFHRGERHDQRTQPRDLRSQGRGFRDEDYGHSRFYSPQPHFDEQHAYTGPTGSYSGYNDREWERNDWDRAQFRDEDWNTHRAEQGYYGSRARFDQQDDHRFSEQGAYGRGGQRLGAFSPEYGARLNRPSRISQHEFDESDRHVPHYGRSYGQSAVYGNNGAFANDQPRRYEIEGARGEYRGPREDSWQQNVRDEARAMVRDVKRVFRGPKGYTRSDERIREDVSDRLGQQDEVDPSEIEVRVQNGEVTLTGTVQSRHEKFVAEELTDEVSGVRDVHNQLRVRRAEDVQTAQTATHTQAQSPNGLRNGRA